MVCLISRSSSKPEITEMYTAILCSEVLDNIKMHTIHTAFHKIGVGYMTRVSCKM